MRYLIIIWSVLVILLFVVFPNWHVVDANLPVDTDYRTYLEGTSLKKVNADNLRAGDRFRSLHLMYAKCANKGGISANVSAAKMNYLDYTYTTGNYDQEGNYAPMTVSFKEGGIGYISGTGWVEVVSIERDRVLLRYYKPYYSEATYSWDTVENGRTVHNVGVRETDRDLRTYGITQNGIREFLNGTLFYMSKTEINQGFSL